MEQSRSNEQVTSDVAGHVEGTPMATAPIGPHDSVRTTAAQVRLGTALPAQEASQPCPTCSCAAHEATSQIPYVYVLGEIEVSIPRLSIEKELAQATGRADPGGRTDRQVLNRVLSQRENRYLAREMCWILRVQGLETYILLPRDLRDLDLLIHAVEPHEDPWISTVIGVRGPLAPPEYCNGLVIPMLMFDQIHTFSHRALIEAIPRPGQVPAEDFASVAREVFHRIMQMTDNAGATDRDRALNYLAVRYSEIYAKAAEKFAGDFSLTAVETRSSPLSGMRNIIEVIFAFTHRRTYYAEKFSVRVDITEKYPFLTSPLAQYFDR